jgi:hypothetical protein
MLVGMTTGFLTRLSEAERNAKDGPASVKNNQRGFLKTNV